MKKTVLVFVLALLHMNAALAQEPPEGYQRAVHNYQDILSGKTQFENLPAKEQKDLETLLKAMRSDPPKDASDKCKNAWNSAQNAAREESDNTSILKRCLESGEFKDDCAGQFKKVKYRQQDYETAVADVNTNCK